MFLITFSNIYVVQGTTFVLQKKTEPRQRLLSTISLGIDVKEVRMPLILKKKKKQKQKKTKKA